MFDYSRTSVHCATVYESGGLFIAFGNDYFGEERTTRLC